MAKEIHEQPEVVGHTLANYIDMAAERVALPMPLPFDFRTLNRISIAACGTAYYAGMVARYWFEHFAHLPVEVDIASEFRYRDAPLATGQSRDLRVAIGRDRRHAGFAALCARAPAARSLDRQRADLDHRARERRGDADACRTGDRRRFDQGLHLPVGGAGALAIAAGRARGVLARADEKTLVHALIEVPRHLDEALALEPQIEQLARDLAKSRDVLYLGRGTSYPLALEGALKLKEISYIHAEGYAAGELKHGPIALIDENMPVIVIAPYDKVFEKTVSNMQEVAARGGRLILMTDAQGARQRGADGQSIVTLTLPTVHAAVAPLVYAVPVQLLAYHTAVIMGTDVDQPRNLAKSVTVE